MVNRHWMYTKKWAFFIVIPLMIITGCATPQSDIPQEGIRANADQAFEELSAAENPSGPKAADQSRNREKRHRQIASTQAPAVKVTKGKRPDWIDGQSRHYPANMYLTGVGYGKDRQTSEDSALGAASGSTGLHRADRDTVLPKFSRFVEPVPPLL